MALRKLTPPDEALVKIPHFTLPSWQVDTIDEIGQRWRAAMGPENRLTTADLMRSVIAAGLTVVGRVVQAGDREELRRLWLRGKGMQEEPARESAREDTQNV